MPDKSIKTVRASFYVLAAADNVPVVRQPGPDGARWPAGRGRYCICLPRQCGLKLYLGPNHSRQRWCGDQLSRGLRRTAVAA